MSTAQQMLTRMMLELSYKENVERMEEAGRLIDYYNGQQLCHLSHVLKKQFDDPDALRMQPAVDNITQFVADEVSRVFDSPPLLTCDDAAGQALLEKLSADGVLAMVWKLAECYSNLVDVSALHPWWDVDNQMIKTALLPSSAIVVAQKDNDPTAEDAVVYLRRRTDITYRNLVEYVHWDVDNHFIFDQAQLGVYRSPDPETNPEMINPYGIIPFAWLRSSVPVGSFFGPIDEALKNAQDTLNVLLTEANQLAKYQGFSQPVVHGTTDAKIKVDPSRPIMIPATMRDESPGSFEFVTPASKVLDIMAQAKDLIERVCARRGISMTALSSSASAVSGYALKIMNSRLDRRRVDQIPLARAALNRWWLVCKTIWNVHMPGQPVPIDAEMVIKFAEPDYEDDPAASLKNDITAIEAGLMKPADAIMKRYPDITDEGDAQALYEQNLAARQNDKKTYGLSDLLMGEKQAAPGTTAGGAASPTPTGPVPVVAHQRNGGKTPVVSHNRGLPKPPNA